MREVNTMNKGITVQELFESCKEQIKKGNGQKHVLITTDDEGNGYHTLFYILDDNETNIQYALACEHDNHKPDEVVLLG
jgi:hypothetical protein